MAVDLFRSTDEHVGGDAEPAGISTALRWASIAFMGIALGAFTIAVPIRYRELSAFSAAGARGDIEGPLSVLLSPGIYPAAVIGIEIAFVATFTLVSLGIALGGLRDRRSYLFSAVFVGYPVWVTPTLYAVQADGVVGVAIQVLQGGGLLLALHFFLLFPDVRFVPRWTRFAAAFWWVYTTNWVLRPHSILALTDPFDASMTAFIALMMGWTTGMIAQAQRHRIQVDPVQRRQTAWVLIAIGAAIIGYGSVYLTGVVLPREGTARLAYDAFAIPGFLLLALPIAFALAFSMWRHHLFDFGTIVNRTLVYVTVSAMLAAVYLIGVVVVPWALPLTTESDLPVAGSTLAAAALFAPVRIRVQGFVDQRFYRARYDARRTLETFALRMREDVDLDSLDRDLADVAAETFRPSMVALWLPGPEPHAGPPGGRREPARA